MMLPPRKDEDISAAAVFYSGIKYLQNAVIEIGGATDG
jgi:hypothetical protein